MSMKAEFNIEAYLDNPIFKRPELMLLVEARQLLMDEANWVKGTCHRIEEQVNRFCIQGALEEISGKTTHEDGLNHGFDLLGNRYTPADYKKASELMNVVCQLEGSYSRFQAYNDSPSTSHADIINKFTAAIALGIQQIQEAQK
jgi:hypothetical protein